MPKTAIALILIAVAACASTRTSGGVTPAWCRRLKGWQKLFGVVAVVLTVLIILNPEFLALGLFGDAAFFDMLVLALSLQMHATASRACRRLGSVLASGARRLGIPSPGLCYMTAALTLAVGSMVSAFQKAMDRIFS